jgi:VanZ family protein
MILFIRLLAYALFAAVSFATLGPADLRPRSNLSHDGEHALAFVLIGLAFAMGYPRQRLPAAGLTVVMTGLLELGQLFAPGRHARLEDFLVDAAATLLGFGLVWMLDFTTSLMRGSKST